MTTKPEPAASDHAAGQPIGAGKLLNGQWYALILERPRRHQHACWDAATARFHWQDDRGRSCTAGLDEVSEILHDIEQPPLAREA